MYDIAIVGSGPAGANLARLIGDKYKVWLIMYFGLINLNLLKSGITNNVIKTHVSTFAT